MNKALLYLNGFNLYGNGEPRLSEKHIFGSLEKLGIMAVHAQINWKSHEPFQELFERLEAQSNDLLDSTNGLTIAGFSAGGSMGVNLLGKLKNRPVRMISIAGRLSSRDLDPAEAARWGEDLDNRKLFDSVTYCESTTIPSLTDQDKARITILAPEADDIVPPSSMVIPGIEPIVLERVTSHLRASVIGMSMLPALLESAA